MGCIDGMLGSGNGEPLVGSGETLIALGLGVGTCDVGPMTSLSGSVDGVPSPPPLPPPEVTGTVSLEIGSGPGLLPPLNPGEPLVGASDMLGPLVADGGVSEASERMLLGGVIDASRLSMDPTEVAEVSSDDIGPGLEGAGVLGCEVSDGLPPTEGKGLVPEGDPPDGTVGEPELGCPEN